MLTGERVVVVGGGVAGLFAAWELVGAGAQVTLCERGASAEEASWAGGGILMPLHPWDMAAELEPLVRFSQDAYPGVVAQLVARTGIDPGYLRCGALFGGAVPAAGAARGARRLAAHGIAELEPALVMPEGAVLLADAAQIRNPRLLKAMHAFLARAGVDIRTRCAVQRLEVGASGVGVRIPGGVLEADRAVLATGAWTDELTAPLGWSGFIAPVKGQMLLFELPRASLRHVVVTDDVYLVPRGDGMLLVGSTVEHCGYDKTPTPEARRTLHAAAARLLPALAGLQPIRHWAGLRPGTRDSLPCIGPLPRCAQVFLHAGHGRLGLTLAPATARLLVDAMSGSPSIADPAAFSPARPVATAT